MNHDKNCNIAQMRHTKGHLKLQGGTIYLMGLINMFYSWD